MNRRAVYIIFTAGVLGLAAAIALTNVERRCTLYEQYTRQISDTVDGPFKPRVYVRCIQEERE